MSGRNVSSGRRGVGWIPAACKEEETPRRRFQLKHLCLKIKKSSSERINAADCSGCCSDTVLRFALGIITEVWTRPPHLPPPPPPPLALHSS